ncbi:hypothetical protein [Motilimonas cestriensis]|uniref:hypothetical protein n=1 Tax=Motilimonas cestriensis TaxID=2742685 RepID=UPI003DA39B3F
MRVFRTTPKSKHQELVRIFPVLKARDTDISEQWDSVAITVFDHWLSREDASRYFDHRTEHEQKLFDSMWAKSYELLALEFMPYRVKYKSVSHVSFREPKSSELLIKRLEIKNNLSLLTLVFPEQKAIYEQSYDDTHLLYFQCYESVKPLFGHH